MILMRLFPLLIIALLGLSSTGQASYEIGTATTSVTSGRTVPALHTAIGFSSFTLSFLAAGVKTSLYSNSAYRLLILKEWGGELFFWGPITTGVGAGLAYTHRSWVADLSLPSEPEIQSEYLAGPAWRLTWEFGGPVFLGIEALFGLRQPMTHLLLSFQDFISLNLGVRL